MPRPHSTDAGLRGLRGELRRLARMAGLRGVEKRLDRTRGLESSLVLSLQLSRGLTTWKGRPLAQGTVEQYKAESELRTLLYRIIRKAVQTGTFTTESFANLRGPDYPPSRLLKKGRFRSERTWHVPLAKLVVTSGQDHLDPERYLWHLRCQGYHPRREQVATALQAITLLAVKHGDSAVGLVRMTQEDGIAGTSSSTADQVRAEIRHELRSRGITSETIAQAVSVLVLDRVLLNSSDREHEDLPPRSEQRSRAQVQKSARSRGYA
jgi:hypothetical protein